MLEGGVDYNLWFWSSTCGHVGTNNDINVWDTSPLLTFFLSPECPDFPYRINDKAFDKLWCLVDWVCGMTHTISRCILTNICVLDSVLLRVPQVLPMVRRRLRSNRSFPIFQLNHWWLCFHVVRILGVLYRQGGCFQCRHETELHGCVFWLLLLQTHPSRI